MGSTVRKLKPFKEKRKLKVLSTFNDDPAEMSTSQLKAELRYYKQRLDTLQAQCLERFIRSPETIEENVNKEIDTLAGITNVVDLQYYAESKFNSEWFYNEPDSEYKMTLAENLLGLLRSKIKGYKNLLWQGVMDNSLEYKDFTKNFIIEE